MKRLLVTFMVIAVGLSVIAPDISAQNSGNAQASKRQQNVEAWKQDMQKFNAKIKEDHKLNELADSLASIQAIAAIRNKDFVLQVDNVTFRSGNTAFVNSSCVLVINPFIFEDFSLFAFLTSRCNTTKKY